MEMLVGKEVDSQRPRFALAERLLFYELEHDKSNIVLRIETIDAYTKEQLVNFPIDIILSDKNRRNHRYKMVYREKLYHDTIKQKQAAQPSFKLLRIGEHGEFDITDSVQLSVSSSASQSFYSLRIDFPMQLIEHIEEPVMGIISKVDRKLYDANYSTRPDKNSKMKQQNKPKDEIIFDDKPSEPVVQQSYTIPPINIWFRIMTRVE